MKETRPAGSARPAILATALLTIALVLLLAGPVSSAAAATVKPWTVMIYCDADNSLETYGPKDFVNEMCNPGSGSNVNFVCLMDRGTVNDSSYGGWTDTKLFYCTAGQTPTAANALEDWGERNMGDPQTMIDFLDYCKTNYPADHYVLCMWDHGYLWFPQYYIVRDDTGDALGNPDSLDMHEQAAAFAAAGGADVIGSDQCQMQMVENLSVWKPYCKAVVASENTVNWTGLDYGAMGADLQAHPTWTAEQAANDFCEKAVAVPGNDSWTYSVVQLDARFDNLVAVVNDWSIALKAGLPANLSAYTSAWNSTQKFEIGEDKDLYDAAANIKAAVSDPTIKAKCDAVMAAVDNVVTFNWTDGTQKEKDAHGLAIWWPKPGTEPTFKFGSPSVDYWAYYRTQIPFGATNSWTGFLGAPYYADYTAPTTTSSADSSWHRSPYTVTLSATDNAGGSGVWNTQYKRLAGGAWQSGTSVSLRKQIKYRGGDGLIKLYFRSSDVAANYETPQTVTVKVDGYGPSTADDADGLRHASPVTVHFTARDRFSGVSATYYHVDGASWHMGTSVVIPAPGDHSNDGLHTIQYFSIDNVGNSGTVRSCRVVIDTKGAKK